MPLWSLRWPPRSGEPLLGIDMGPSQACLLACSRASPLGRIEQCAALPVPADGLQDGRILQFELMAQTLKQLVASAGGGRRIALALPEAAWQQELVLPAGLRPWAWRPWLVAQAEQLAQTSADALVWCTEPLMASPLKLRLTVRSLEEVQDWQGLAEAAGLDLVLLDDRQRVMHLALRALAEPAAAAALWVLAEVDLERCVIHRWAPGLAHEQRSWAGESVPLVSDPWGWPASGALAGTPEACQFWAPRLAAELGGAWPVLDPWSRLSWRAGLSPPSEMGCPLAALGLSLRTWRP
jgi:hypothetical protein